MLGKALTAGYAAALVAWLAFAEGGYFAADRGLLLGALALTGLAVGVLGEPHALGRAGVLVVAALGGLAAWTALSASWAPLAGPALEDAQRVLAYAAAAALALLALTRARVPALCWGIAAGALVTAAYGLATRLYPGDVGGIYDPSSGYQLAEPIGYWNALGLLCSLGLILLAGLALAGGPVRLAAAGAASVPLATALYFTASRGSMLALALGLTVLVALAPSRLRALGLVGALAVAPGVAVQLASGNLALTAPGQTLQTAQRQGHRLAWQLALLVLLGAAIGAAAAVVDRRLRLGARARRALWAALGGATAAAAAVALVAGGGPVAILDRAGDAFAAELPDTGGDLNRKLLAVSGNGRVDYWRVAWHMVERAPLAGEGGAAFERWWLEERPVPHHARDAHSLYLETLAELGPPGLALLLAALAVPLLAVPRARAAPAGPALGGAYAAFLAHAALDWDWELPVVTLVAVACGCGLLVLERPRASVRRRAVASAAWAALLVVALAVHVGNRALADAEEAIASDEPAAAEQSARRARTWLPWSTGPELVLGQAQTLAGRDGAARRTLRKAAQREPESWAAWYALAVVAEGREQAEALRRARALNPLGPEVEELADEIRTDS